MTREILVPIKDGREGWHARINAIETSAAERMPGVRCILLGRDVDLRYGQAQRILVGQMTPQLAADSMGKQIDAILAKK